MMSYESPGLDMLDLQNVIDSEFEVAKTANICNRKTDLLNGRVDVLSVKQTEIKGLLESIDAQLKEGEQLCGRGSRSKPTSTEGTIVSGAKESPIVIDDEVSLYNSTQASDTSKVMVNSTATTPRLVQSKPDVAFTNMYRRPLIVEKMAYNDIYGSEASPTGGLPSSDTFPFSCTLSLFAGQKEQVSTNTVPPVSTPSVPEAASLPFSSGNSDNGSSVDSATDSAPSPAAEEIPATDSVVSDLASHGQAITTDRKLRSTETRQPIVSPVTTKRPHSPSGFKVGSRVLGKRSSDIWFPGEIVKTIPDRYKQTKYSIKYDKGQKGVLSLNHISPEAPATAQDLSVGSRVVGLYGRLDIWYAGIVAEMPCGDNKNRFLIFFDDGFAQYLSAKKLHKVHHKGKNVWEDVAEHSRDFIQEYLEDYPSRPMLHVRVGQWIRTEWLGEWLKAKVLSVDGSLVKMLFQVDNRSEWIYRGSTRLDPLYKALVLGEKATPSKARSRKLTRNTSTRGNTPYVEYNITKASFGISPYSKTDPKGIQQHQLEEQRKITQLQRQPQQETNAASKTCKSIKTITTPETTTKKDEKTVQKEQSKSPSKQKEEIVPSIVTTQVNDLIAHDPVISSTYSCIQASSMRKKTGASLVNTGVFREETTETHRLVSPTLKAPEETPALLPVPHPVALPDPHPVPFPPTSHSENTPKTSGKNGRDCQWRAPWLNLEQRNKQRHHTQQVMKPGVTGQSGKPRDAASILKNKLDASVEEETGASEKQDRSPVVELEPIREITGPHTCNSGCTQAKRTAPIDQLRHNPLAVPLMLDWKREIVKRRGKTNKRDVYYRTPCHRRLRNMVEVFSYLRLTKETGLSVDQFSFDWRIRTKDMAMARPIVADISNKLENRPLPAVNEVDSSRPPDVQYVSDRQLAAEDSTKCACIQLTLQGCKAMEGKDGDKATYQYRRLKDCLQTGIYECNSQCSCSKSCLNRVVQNGIQMRMEVFKTENRGWGLRAVDDIPAGTFICTYAGYILNEELANQEGRDYGDEYMAELDYIEVAERAKEGYESGVSDLEEDDNVIHEMLEFDENLSESEVSVSNEDQSPHANTNLDDMDEDDDDEDDDDEDEEEDDVDDDENDASTSDDNCSLSSEDENYYGQRRKTLRSSKPKVACENQQKKSGTISEESLVVERESKAIVLSRLTDPFMCVLALKRNHNDLTESAKFLKNYLVGQDVEPMIVNTTDCTKINGVPTSAELTGIDDRPRGVLSSSDFDLDDLSDDVLAVIHGGDNQNSSNDNGIVSSIQEQEYPLPVDENKQTPLKEIAKKDEISLEEQSTCIATKEDVPELLSAEDLKRLAASQPKSDEPPVLLKAGEAKLRDTVLDETIEKLKKRVVSLETHSEPSNSSMDTDEAREYSTAEQNIVLAPSHVPTTSGEDVTKDGDSGSGKTSSIVDKEMDINDEEIIQSEESSVVSHSSVSQSVSSRCSTPLAVDRGKEFDESFKKIKEGGKALKDSELANVQSKGARTRPLFGEEHCYVIDAKTFGNCGRFLNHSCTPNLFVQNVFVDTHDLRFPWVAFFAQHNIKAGAELNWDYMYEVGSVHDKVLHCLCGSSECRGRLL